MKRKLQNLLVTGGAGFIGSNFIRYLFEKADFDGDVVNLDVLTYAGNPANLADMEKGHGGTTLLFRTGRHLRPAAVQCSSTSTHRYGRPLRGREPCRPLDQGPRGFCPDECHGNVHPSGRRADAWTERGRTCCSTMSAPTRSMARWAGRAASPRDTPYDPRSPYSASKAGSDHLVMAYHHTYGLPVTLSNCSNNYGPCQFPEKLVPLMILNMLEGKRLLSTETDATCATGCTSMTTPARSGRS